MSGKQTSESLAYHAARLLILVSICGRPQNKQGTLPGIEGRTLLAKLDFFFRYPSYLQKAATILGYRDSEHPTPSDSFLSHNTIESSMIRYLYGPWDHLYYPVLAYLIGKGLIEVNIRTKTEIFRITARGARIAADLQAQEANADLVQRGKLVRSLFHRFNGTRLKDFIYENFPEVVAREIGGTI